MYEWLKELEETWADLCKSRKRHRTMVLVMSILQGLVAAMILFVAMLCVVQERLVTAAFDCGLCILDTVFCCRNIAWLGDEERDFNELQRSHELLVARMSETVLQTRE